MNAPITSQGALTQAVLNQINLALSNAGILTQGNIYWVRPRTGSDASDGLGSTTAFQTIQRGFAACVANQNDVVVLCAEGNNASDTTARVSVTLDWNKGAVHLIGINSGTMVGQRSRIAFLSTYDTASNLLTVSANGCLFQNLELFAGVAGTNPTGCLKVSGQRNHFVNCQISGMGNSANDIAGAYSLSLPSGAENTFDGCYIGLDTVTLGAAANSQIVCSAAATRNVFRNCVIPTYTNHATNNNFLRAPTGSLDRWILFQDCLFINPVDASSTALTQAFIVASDAGGSVLLHGKTGVIGATDWNSTDSGNVRGILGTVTAGTFGLGVAVTR